MKNLSRRDLLGRLPAVALVGAAWTPSALCLSQGTETAEPHWRTPQELVRIGFGRSRVVMMNEAHNFPMRSIRTRKVGISILPAAHEAGVRYLAMEALYPYDIADFANRERRLPDTFPINVSTFLSQPEMRDLTHGALTLGWTLVPYEADLSKAGTFRDPTQQINWRDEQQGRNLSNAIGTLDPKSKILVWCGLGHLYQVADERSRPMGFQFAQMSGIRAFAIDQVMTVNMTGNPAYRSRFAVKYKSILERYGGTAGFLTEEGAPPLLNLSMADAFIVSTDNEME